MVLKQSDSPASLQLSSQRKRDLLDYYETNVEELDRWRKFNVAYHEDDLKFMRFLIPPGKRIVHITNHEGDLLDWLNTAADEQTAVVLNAGAWTHYSLALYDACAQLSAPLVEVHLSDPASRPEEFRHHSVVTPHAVRVIAGQGVDGYREALRLLGGPPYSFTAHVAEVSVDEETGIWKVEKIWAAHDCGKALNPTLVVVSITPFGTDGPEGITRRGC